MYINLVCEDQLSEVVIKKMIYYKLQQVEIYYQVLGLKGQGYIKNRINDFNKTDLPFFILTDLDSQSCAPSLIKNWIKQPLKNNIIFRVAVREVESWLLADTKGFSKYLNLKHDFVKKEVNNPDSIMDPKLKLLSLVNHSRKRDIREDLINMTDKTLKQGPAYNIRLTQYVNNYWDIEKAILKSDSLKRAITSLESLKGLII